MKTPPLSSFLLSGLAALAAAVVFFPPSPARESARRSVAGSNLRQIGQASLIYSSDHADKLPVAENIWDYAGELARGAGLNDSSIWMSGGDPAHENTPLAFGTVLTEDRFGVEPTFRSVIPSWAAPLGGLDATMPATTPIAWTRGLLTNGTWPAHAPNGTDGGHVVFLGGNVSFYRHTTDAFHRFDGRGMTSNILEALPPGTRIGEYEPSEQERAAWARTWRSNKMKAVLRPFLFPGLWALALVVLLVQVARKRWPAWMLRWFLALSFVAGVVTPTVS